MENNINITLSHEEKEFITLSGLNTEEYIHKAILNMSPAALNKRQVALLNIATAVNDLQFSVEDSKLPIVRRIKKEIERLCSI